MTCMKAANFLKSNVKNEKLGATVLAFLEVTDINSINLFSSTSSAFTWTVESSRHYFAIKCAKLQRIPVGHPFLQSSSLSPHNQPFYMLENSINTFTSFSAVIYSALSFPLQVGTKCSKAVNRPKEKLQPHEPPNPAKMYFLSTLGQAKAHVQLKLHHQQCKEPQYGEKHSQFHHVTARCWWQQDHSDRYSKLVHFSPCIQIPTGQAGDCTNPLYICIFYVDVSSVLALLFQTPILYTVKWRTWSKIQSFSTQDQPK